MSPTDLAQLLKLPAGERAQLAIVLWESFTEGERAAELALEADDRAELDRRWAEHLADPASVVPWSTVWRKRRPGP